ncbi:MAG: hypothetical protein SGI88_20090 [Candidatus Hydrogenedentes bacterium]|nr:hypothetical protein [Candidatus Hydrogenedentota bacterium]
MTPSTWSCAATRIALAILIWLGVGLSLGWYYTFTYYGRTGVPMPTIEPCAALVLYYFSVINVRTEIQAVHWMIVYPAAGLLWAWALQITARYMKLETPKFSVALFALACAAIPLAIPAPWMTWVAGHVQEKDFEMSRMLLVALRREEQAPWTALTPMYVALGFVALGCQLYVYRRLYKLSLNVAVKHYLISAVVLSGIAAVIGATAALPMRYLLE